MTGLQKIWLWGIMAAVLSNPAWAQDFMGIHPDYSSDYSLPVTSNAGISSLSASPDYTQLNQFLIAYKMNELEGIKFYINCFPIALTQQIRGTVSKDEFMKNIPGVRELIKEKEGYEYFYDAVVRYPVDTDQGKNTLFFLSFSKNLPEEITDILAVKLNMAQTDQEREYLLDVLLSQEDLSGFAQERVKKCLRNISSHILSELNAGIFHLLEENELFILDSNQKRDLDYRGYNIFPRQQQNRWKWKIRKIGAPAHFFNIGTAKGVLANRLGAYLLEFRNINLPSIVRPEYLAAHELLCYMTAAVYTKDITIPEKNGGLYRTAVMQQLAEIKKQMEGNDSSNWQAVWRAAFNAVEQGRPLADAAKAIYAALGFSEEKIYLRPLNDDGLMMIEKINFFMYRILRILGRAELYISYVE